MDFTLPPLRRRVFGQIFKIVLILGALSFLLLIMSLNPHIHFSRNMRYLVYFIFVVGFVYAIYLSEALSNNIANPIKQINQVLQNNNILNIKLKFPDPTCIEIKVLISEITQLHQKFSQLNAKNIQNLESQRREMEAIFSVMEDAAVVFDSQNKIQYYNQGFLEILGITDEKIINENKWDDLSIMTDSYMQLRRLLRKEQHDEVLFNCVIKEEDRIYRTRKKIVFDTHQKKAGVILLLHDITKKVPSEKFKEMLHNLKIENNDND